MLLEFDPLLLLFVAMAPPLSLHPLDEIVNVHWESGLAVEFFPKQDGEGSTGG
jgi:hypothetical protein